MILSSKHICEECNTWSDELIKPCRCDIYLHRECFSKYDRGVRCEFCNTNYLFSYPFLQKVLRDETRFTKYFLITAAGGFLLSMLLLVYVLKLHSTVEIFYLLVILSSIAANLIDFNCGLTPMMDNMFSMDPQHIDKFISSLCIGSVFVRNWGLRKSNWYVCNMEQYY